MKQYKLSSYLTLNLHYLLLYFQFALPVPTSIISLAQVVAGDRKMVVKHKVEGYEAYLKLLKELEVHKKNIYILFSGSLNEKGVSWCPNCVEGNFPFDFINTLTSVNVLIFMEVNKLVPTYLLLELDTC